MGFGNAILRPASASTQSSLYHKDRQRAGARHGYFLARRAKLVALQSAKDLVLRRPGPDTKSYPKLGTSKTFTNVLDCGIVINALTTPNGVSDLLFPSLGTLAISGVVSQPFSKINGNLGQSQGFSNGAYSETTSRATELRVEFSGW